MALIKCPECGKEISDKAVACPNCGAPIRELASSIEQDSGTETFHVEAKNRLELSAKVDAEINTRTVRLSDEGKNIVNIQKSDPQAFTLGVTLWKMDVVIIWNASLNSAKYKQFIYNQARKFQLLGNYSEALKNYRKISDYSDVSSQIQICSEQSREQLKKEIEERNERREISQNLGKNPADNALVVYSISGIILFCFFVSLIGTLDMALVTQAPRIISGLICVICIAVILWKKKQVDDYNAKIREYKQKKQDKQ